MASFLDHCETMIQSHECVVYAQEAMYFCFRISPLLAFKKSNAAQPQAELSCHDNSHAALFGSISGVFGKCLGSVWEVFGKYSGSVRVCLGEFLEVFAECLRVLGKCLGSVWGVFGIIRD